MNWVFSCKKYKDEVKYLHRELDKMHHIVNVYKRAKSELTDTIVKLHNTKNKKRKTHEILPGRKTGYKKVSKKESLEMYELWNTGMNMTEIANKFNRSNSCVSEHINKHYKEDNENDNTKKIETNSKL